MDAVGRSAMGIATSFPRRIIGAQARVFVMKRPGRSNVQAMVPSVTLASAARTHLTIGLSGFLPPPPSAESLTIRDTLARRQAAATARSWVGSGRAPIASALIEKTPKMPSNAASRVRGSSKSPCTTSTPAGTRSRSGRRVMARTDWPRASSSLTSSLPTWPVAPVMRNLRGAAPDWLLD